MTKKRKLAKLKFFTSFFFVKPLAEVMCVGFSLKKLTVLTLKPMLTQKFVGRVIHTNVVLDAVHCHWTDDAHHSS